MRKKLYFFIVTILFIALGLPVFSQSGGTAPAAHLVYFDDEYEVEVFHADGTPFDYVDWDMEIPAGATIKTHNSTAELELDPNGSIIKLSTNTDFTVEGFQTSDNTANTFTLLAGKIRTVAAHSGKGENYSFQTPSAVCGVRGTDFGLQAIPGKSDAVAVIQGAVEFINTVTGQSIEVAAGQAADVFSDVFQAITMSQEQLTNLFSGMGFERVSPANVPGNDELSPVQQALQPEQPAPEPQPAAEPAVPPAEPAPAEEPAPEPAASKNDPLSGVMDFLGKYLGMELGTITINNETYAKAVLQPKLNIGKFRMALYLPVIYKTDMFDPADWYRPEGNDEWSFGTDQTGTWPIIKDVIRDVALKIKYLEYGDNRDPFFFKIGNIESITLGHGLLMRSFPADIGFPAVRHIGFNLGLDLKAVGFEALVTDFAVPEIMGGRFYFRPVYKTFPFAIGLSSIVDLNPAGQVVPDSGGNVETYGNPVFISAALDLDLPIIDNDFISIVLFADGGGLLPYYREAYSSTIQQGPAWSAIYSSSGSFTLDSLNNVGMSAGVLGNIAIVDYRIEFRYSKGIFKPALFSTDYHRNRGAYTAAFARYFADPAAAEFQDPTLGIYGEAGVDIGKLGTIEAGYLWPMSIDDAGTVQMADTDMFHLEMVLFPDVIPVVGIHGSLTYDRTHFAQTILRGKQDNLTLFDAYTTVTGQLAVPVGKLLEVAITYTTSTAYDDAGNVVADENNPSLPKVYPSISIETRVNF